MTIDQASKLALHRSSVEEARARIAHHVHLTPVLTSSTLNDIISAPRAAEDLVDTPWRGHVPARPRFKFFFKCENFQKIGAFKIRGASHALSRLSREELARGVVTHSSGVTPERLQTGDRCSFHAECLIGNHAQALALAAKRFDCNAHIVMPRISTPSKIAGTRAQGGTIYFSGSTEDERVAVANTVMEKTGAVFIPPFNHPHIILGQGTMALELEEQVAELVRKDPSVSVHQETSTSSEECELDRPSEAASTSRHCLDAVVAPLGGGGMLAGIATALGPTPTRVFGAEPSFQGADDGRRGLAAGKRIERVKSLTIADGLRTPVGELNWEVISDKQKVDGVFSVTDQQIRQAMKLVMERLKLVIEPSAAVGVAVAMFDEDFRRQAETAGGWDVGIILSGGNVGMDALGHILADDKESMEVDREKGLIGMDGDKTVENVPG